MKHLKIKEWNRNTFHTWQHLHGLKTIGYGTSCYFIVSFTIVRSTILLLLLFFFIFDVTTAFSVHSLFVLFRHFSFSFPFWQRPLHFFPVDCVKFQKKKKHSKCFVCALSWQAVCSIWPPHIEIDIIINTRRKKNIEMNTHPFKCMKKYSFTEEIVKIIVFAYLVSTCLHHHLPYMIPVNSI